MLVLSLALLTGAHAQDDIITDIGNPVALGGEGYRATWARAFPDESGGWHFFRAAGGDYLYHHMTEGLELENDLGEKLTGRTDLVDHAISRCEDGTWLHVGSLNSKPNANDGAWVHRYDTDFNVVAATRIAEEDEDTTYNDAPVLCSAGIDVAVFQSVGNPDDLTPLMELAADGSVVGEVMISSQPNVGGSALFWDADLDRLFLARAWSIGPVMQVDAFDSDLNLLESYTIKLGSDNEDIYWTQSALKLGDLYFVSHMRRTGQSDFVGDTGNVWVSVFDIDWNLVEQKQITNYEAPIGAMQPWLAAKGESMLVLFDHDVQPTVAEVVLDLEAGGSDQTNEAPVADAGADKSVVVGEPVYLNARDSSDPNDDALTFVWTFDTVPDGSGLGDGDLVDAETPEAAFTPDAAGTYVVQVEVGDGEFSDTATVTVTVTEAEEGCAGCASGTSGGFSGLLLAGLVLGIRRRR